MKLIVFLSLLTTLSVSNAPGPMQVLTKVERSYAIEQLELSRAQLKLAVEGLSIEQLQFKPSPEKWSIEEIVEHIALAENGIGQIVAGSLQQLIDTTRRKEIRVTDAQIRQILTNRLGKAQSPEIIKPTGRFANVQTSIAFFDKGRDKNIGLIQNTQEDLRDRYWQHPATGTIDLYQSILLISAHCERHTAQIKEVKSNTLFPK